MQKKLVELIGVTVKTGNTPILQDISLTDALSNGTYFVVITTNGKQFRERLILIGK